MPFTITTLSPSNADYPSAIRRNAAHEAQVPVLYVLGDVALLHHPLLALLASVRCPGDAILRAYDLARELRDAGVPVVGGFHSPMEKECLDLLLRGQQPVVICPARSLSGMRVPAAWRAPIADGRILLVSPFDERQRRVTAELAEQRNRLVSKLAAAVLVLHAGPGSQTEALALRALVSGKPVFVAVSGRAERLMEAGARRADFGPCSWPVPAQTPAS